MNNENNLDHITTTQRNNRRRNRRGRRFYSNNHQGRNGIASNTEHPGVDSSGSTERNGSSPSSSNTNHNRPHSDQSAVIRGSGNETEVRDHRNYERRRPKANNHSRRETSHARNSSSIERAEYQNPCNEENNEKRVKITDRRNLFPCKYDSGDIICCISPDDVDGFQKSTYFWFYSAPPLSSPTGNGPIPSTWKKPSGSCALYSVIFVSKAKIARLQAITVDLWLNGRGDLREILLTKDATNTLTGRRYNPKKNLMVGDVIFVQRVSPTAFSKENRWDSVVDTKPEERNKPGFKHRWLVDEYQLVERRVYDNRLAVAVERLCEKDDDEEDVTSLLLAVEGVGEIVEMSAQNLSSEYLTKDSVMVGSVFLPPPRSAVFSYNPPDQFNRNLLEQQYGRAGRHKPPRPRFLSQRLCTEYERNCLDIWRNSLFKELPLQSATEWLHRGFALSVPSLSAFERSKIDTSFHSVQLKITEKGEDYLRFCFDSDQGSWSSGQNIVIRMASGIRCFGRVTYIEKENLDDRSMTERERRIWMKNKGHLLTAGVVVHAKAAGIHALTIYRSFSKKVVVRQTHMRVQGSEEEFYTGEELLDLNPDHRFHGAVISAFGGEAQSLKRSEVKWNNPSIIRYDGGYIKFLKEQMEVLDAVINSDSVVVVSAGFGCGKTLLSNVMLARLAQKYPEKVHAIVVQCNFAVVNAVNVQPPWTNTKVRRSFG